MECCSARMVGEWAVGAEGHLTPLAVPELYSGRVVAAVVEGRAWPLASAKQVVAVSITPRRAKGVRTSRKWGIYSTLPGRWRKVVPLSSRVISMWLWACARPGNLSPFRGASGCCWRDCATSSHLYPAGRLHTPAKLLPELYGGCTGSTLYPTIATVSLCPQVGSGTESMYCAGR